MKMKARLIVLLLLAACGGKNQVAPAPTPDAGIDVRPPVEVSKSPKQKGKSPPAVAKPAPQTETAKSTPKADESELPVEEQETNPDSETVNLRLAISPPTKGVVMWGQKPMARFSPGSMDVEIIRPRGSGPLDLEVRADGFLVHRTRLFADRNDKTNVRLYRAEDAVGLHGYKPPLEAK